MVKRWWWVAVAVIVVVGVAAYLLAGRGLGGNTGASGTGASATSGTPPPAPPADVAAVGAKLTAITGPPNRLIAQVRYSAAEDGQQYKAQFLPYGTGPSRNSHHTLAVRLATWSPAQSYDTTMTLAGQNLLLEEGTGVSITKGGVYDGLVKLAREGDALVFQLISVKSAL